MKDALGHGSNGLAEALRARFPESTILKSSSDAVHSTLPMAQPHPVNGGSYTPPRMGGQSLVRAARGAGKTFSSPLMIKGITK